MKDGGKVERDPRVDPKVGDKLSKPQPGYYPDREVSDVDGRDVYWVSDRTCEVKMRLVSWRKWAKDAEVIHAS